MTELVFTPVQAVPPNTTAASTTSSTLAGAAAQVAAAANTRRSRVIFSNFGAALMVIRFTTNPTLTAGIIIPPGSHWDSGSGPVHQGALNVIGTTGQAYSVTEFLI